MRRRGRRLLLAPAVAVALAGPPAAGAPDCEALALFDAGCAGCHEAQCSGRLTFGDPSRARSHVERHAGTGLGDERVAELIELLLVIKETCRLDATAAARCGAPPWTAAQLRRVRAPGRRAWFVPLGTPAGPQRLALRFDRDTTASVRVTTAAFEVLLEVSRRTRKGGLELDFAAADGETLFARVESAGAAELLGVRVLAGPAPR